MIQKKEKKKGLKKIGDLFERQKIITFINVVLKSETSSVFR